MDGRDAGARYSEVDSLSTMNVNHRPISVSTTVNSGAISTDIDGGGGGGGGGGVADSSPASPPPRPVLVTTTARGSLIEERSSQWPHRPSRLSRTSRTSRWTITAREDSAAGFYYDQMTNPPTGEGDGALGSYENLGGYVEIGGDYTGAAPQLVVRNTALKTESQVSQHFPTTPSTPYLVGKGLQLVHISSHVVTRCRTLPRQSQLNTFQSTSLTKVLVFPVVVAWIAFVSIFGGLAFFIAAKTNNKSEVKIFESIFFMASVTTASGLAPYNIPELPKACWWVIFVCMQLGSASIMSLYPVVVRVRSLRKVMPSQDPQGRKPCLITPYANHLHGCTPLLDMPHVFHASPPALYTRRPADPCLMPDAPCSMPYPRHTGDPQAPARS